MTDCGHDHIQDQAAEHRAVGGRLLAALAVIVVIMVVEVIGGLISGSLALLADAGHMLTDALALALALSAHWLSARPADDKLHFGYQRLQVLAAFVNGIALALLMAWLVFEAVKRSIEPIAVSWAPMLAVASLGLAANVVAFRLLHRAGAHNINIKGAMLHVASDLLGSLAAVIAAIVIWQTGWTRIDPILSIVVAALIGRSAFKLLKETSHILMEGAPHNLDPAAIATDLKLANAEIEDIHKIKIWQLTPDRLSLTLHARVRKGAGEAALQSIKARLEKRYGITESTIQIESGGGCPDVDRAEDGPNGLIRLYPHAHDHADDAHRRSALRTARGSTVAAIQSIFK